MKSVVLHCWLRKNWRVELSINALAENVSILNLTSKYVEELLEATYQRQNGAYSAIL